jgi:hypothetical protein
MTLRHVGSALNVHLGCHQGPPARQYHSGVTWQYWTVCRSSISGLPGPHYLVFSEQQTMRWRRLTLIFNSGPTCNSLFKYLFKLYPQLIFRLRLPKAFTFCQAVVSAKKKRGQQVLPVCLFSPGGLHTYCFNLRWDGLLRVLKRGVTILGVSGGKIGLVPPRSESFWNFQWNICEVVTYPWLKVMISLMTSDNLLFSKI